MKEQSPFPPTVPAQTRKRLATRVPRPKLKCSICGLDHAPGTSCSTLLRRGSGTAELRAWSESSQTESGVVGEGVGPAGGVDPVIGMSFGSFRVVKMIGRGGMGTVYLGEQTVIGSKVAIKILHDHLASNASLVARFYAEAKAVNLIGHENIVNIFDMNVVPPNRYYLIMELLEGRALNAIATGALDPELVVPILVQVCDALDAAHAHGVVHRDLKPENIFLIRRGRNENFAKILDFGIAKLFATQSGAEHTAAGMIVGTPEYMAPEQTTGEKIDGRADIYALGVIAYQLVTGRLPFSGGGLTGLLLAHQTKIPTPPHRVNPSVPLELSAAIMRALAKKVEDRFQTAGELAAALEFAIPPGSSSSSRALAIPPVVSASAPSPWIGSALARPVGYGTPPAGVAVASVPGPVVPSVPPVWPPPPPAITPAAIIRVNPVGHAPALSINQTGTPEPVHPRHAASFDARVMTVEGHSLGALKCQDISKGGCFLCTDDKAPPVFSRVKVRFPVAGDLECLCEVVRHVTRDQAAAWGMSPGFGVQFITLTSDQKEALGRVVSGLPALKTAGPPKSDGDDWVAEQVLGEYRKRISGDHYVLLRLENNAELSEVRARGREARRELEALQSRPISTGQKAQIETALVKIAAAVEVVGTALTRIEFDAKRGNFKGVARCIAAGLTVTEIDAVRATFLRTHQAVETKGRMKFISGNAYEADNQLAKAAEHYEEALTLDPLNLGFQQRYWALKRRAP